MEPDEDTDVDDDASGDETSEDQSSSTGGAGDEETPEKRRVKELSDENARRRVANKELRDQLAAAQASLKEIQDREKGDLEKATERLAELELVSAAKESKIHDLALRNAFLMSTKFRWRNPAAALKLADLSDVEIDDEGTVTGLDKALESLAKSDSYLLASDDDDDEDRQSATGQPPVKKTSKGALDRAKLEAKYPAIRRS